MSFVSANLHRHPGNTEVSDEARGHRPATYWAHCGSFFPPSRDLSLLLLSFVPSAGFAFFAARLFGPASSDDSERPGRAPGTEFDFLSSATRSWTILRCCRAIPLGSCGIVCNPATAAVLATAAINAICKDMCFPRVPVASTIIHLLAGHPGEQENKLLPLPERPYLDSCAGGNYATFTKALDCLQIPRSCRAHHQQITSAA